MYLSINENKSIGLQNTFEELICKFSKHFNLKRFLLMSSKWDKYLHFAAWLF